MMERETGIEPATNSLEGCDSTTELLPQDLAVSKTSPAEAALLPAFNCHQPNDHKPFAKLEPMTRIELVTSPLPRECSTN